jgi:CRP-like cAMP-binding protein
MEATKHNLTTTLRRVPLFADLSTEEISLIAEHVTRLRHERGSVIFSEGDVCCDLLIVEQGSVRIVKSAPSGRQQLIGIERPGSSLAEVPMFDGGRHLTSAEALSDTILLRLPSESFRKICLQNPELSLKVFKVLGSRLRNMVQLVEKLSFSTVRGRLVAHLVGVAEEIGRQTEQGIQFELIENNEELAVRLGTVRELISRNLGRLHGAGLISIKKRTVTIPNLTTLKNEVDAG